MKITLELFGMARHLVGQKVVELELPEGARVADLIASLAERQPELVGTVITDSRRGLIEPSIINIDGRTAVGDAEYVLREGDPVCLMFVAAGG